MLISSCVVLDLYDGLMSSALNEDLLVQSWIELNKSPGDKLPSNCTIPYKVMCLCVVEGYCA